MIFSLFLFLLAVLAIVDFSTTAGVRRQAKYMALKLFYWCSESYNTSEQGKRRSLPDVLGHYLERSGAMRAPAIRTLRMRMKGAVRFGDRTRWQPWEAKYFVCTAGGGGLVWYADITSGLLRSRAQCYSLLDGRSVWMDKSWGFAVSKRPVYRGQTEVFVRFQYIATLPWHPGDFAGQDLYWESVPDGTLEARIQTQEESVVLKLQFDASGNPGTLSCQANTLNVVMNYSDYQEFQGVLRPMQWTMEIRDKGTSHWVFEGRLTDLVEDGAFAWW